MKRSVLLSIFLLIMTKAFSSGGGIYYGTYVYKDRYANIDLENSYYYGGYGYGTNHWGGRIGGFGMVIFNGDAFSGAYGGMISGRELVRGPISAAIDLWTGIGYLSHDNINGVSPIAELKGEIGVAPMPWFQLVVYGGLQGVTTFTNFRDDILYSPVMGIKFVWGSFY